MMYSIVASGVIAGIAAIRLRYKASSGSIEDEGKNMGKGLGIALGLTGFYLFITGIAISFTWPFAISGGLYNVLFGGAAALSGLVLLAFSTALFLGHGLQAASYFGFIVGLYLLVDAYAISKYNLTRDPTMSTLLYLAPAAVLILSVPATHLNNKWMRWLFAIVAFLFSIAWLYFAINVTIGHLQPPPPS
jgi:putative membrane protein